MLKCLDRLREYAESRHYRKVMSEYHRSETRPVCLGLHYYNVEGRPVLVTFILIYKNIGRTVIENILAQIF